MLKNRVFAHDSVNLNSLKNIMEEAKYINSDKALLNHIYKSIFKKTMVCLKV